MSLNPLCFNSIPDLDVTGSPEFGEGLPFVVASSEFSVCAPSFRRSGTLAPVMPT